MTKPTLSCRIPLDRASRATLGANFGIVEKVGLYLPGAGIVSR